jgi:hypothetical protein
LDERGHNHDEKPRDDGELRAVFAEWYDNGHTNESDLNTILLRIRLTDGILFHNGERFEIAFGGK